MSEKPKASEIALGDQSSMPLDDSDMTVANGLVTILFPGLADESERLRLMFILAEHRAVTRQEERKAIALEIRERCDENLKRLEFKP